MATDFSQSELANLADAVAAKLLGGSTQPRNSMPSGQIGQSGKPSQLGKIFSKPATLKKYSYAVNTPISVKSSSVAFASLDDAVDAARAAQPIWASLPIEKRKKIISEVRVLLRRHVQELSELAVEETGLGRVEDKISKNLLVINKTPGPEFLESSCYTGDDGLTLTEYAPYGMIGAITPTTNPSETIINNGISMLSAGNAVVFNPHPSAKRTSTRTVELIDAVVVANGGPTCTMTMVESPTIETAQALMTHKGIRLLVVTGGPAVVKAAMASGKKVIAAGPGNPPVVVDETADLDQAALGIVKGASLDNNIVCIAEKEIIAVDSIVNDLKKKLQQNGAYLLSSYQLRQLEKIVVTRGADGIPHANKKFVGKDASIILDQIGVNVGSDTRMIFAEVGEDHPFVQTELLMPVLGLVRVPNVDEAIAMARRVEHGNCHTAVMYSKNIDNLHHMAKIINTSLFVKNAPSYAGLGLGGEGFTSFTIASPTGEGLTNCRTFSRIRRCILKDHFRIV